MRKPAATWLRRIGWVALAIATVGIALAPDLINLPAPQGAAVIDRATFLPGDGPGIEVSLPHVIYPNRANPLTVRYAIGLDGKALPQEGLSEGGLALYIPELNRRVVLNLDGR